VKRINAANPACQEKRDNHSAKPETKDRIAKDCQVFAIYGSVIDCLKIFRGRRPRTNIRTPGAPKKQTGQKHDQEDDQAALDNPVQRAVNTDIR